MVYRSFTREGAANRAMIGRTRCRDRGRRTRRAHLGDGLLDVHPPHGCSPEARCGARDPSGSPTAGPTIEEQKAISEAWARYEEALAAAEASGDPDDCEAAEDAYLEAMDVTGEAGLWYL